MKLQYFRAQSQSQPCPVAASGPGLVNHVKCLGNLVEFLLRYAHSVILYFKTVSVLHQMAGTDEALEPLYDGKCLPDPNYEKNSLLKVSCYKDKKVDSFYLPVSDMRLDYLRNKLRI